MSNNTYVYLKCEQFSDLCRYGKSAVQISEYKLQIWKCLLWNICILCVSSVQPSVVLCCNGLCSLEIGSHGALSATMYSKVFKVLGSAPSARGLHNAIRRSGWWIPVVFRWNPPGSTPPSTAQWAMATVAHTHSQETWQRFMHYGFRDGNHKKILPFLPKSSLCKKSTCVRP